MTTQYTTILKLALPVQGELSGTWGDVVNDNITQMVEQAIAGKATVNSWTANSHTLTTADGTTSESRCAILELTDSGTALTGAGTVVCPTNTKLYIVDNNTAQIITVKTSGGTGVAVPVGKTMLVYCDGTNVVEGVTHANSLSLGTSTTTVSSVLDEDNMASDSATALATQQSIKAYVDSQVGSFDTLAEVLAQGNTTGGTDIAVGTGDDITFADSSKAIFGTGSDLQIYHDGTNSYISDQGTNDLKVLATDFQLKNAADDEFMMTAVTDGAVTTYHNGSAKLATTATGIAVTGDATFADNGKAIFGAGSDLQIYHDGSNSYVNDTGTGDLVLKTNGAGVQMWGGGDVMLNAVKDGAVSLYHDNAAKLATTTSGIDITGTATAASFETDAGGTFTTAAGNDLNIVYPDGRSLFFKEAGTTTLTLDNVQGATFNGTVTATSSSAGTLFTLQSSEAGAASGPDIVLFRNSSSPADDDALSTIFWQGKNSAGSTKDYMKLRSYILDVTDGTEDFGMDIQVMTSGNAVNALDILPSELIINNAGIGRDFRVESDSNDHMLFVDASTNRIGVNTGSPLEKLQIDDGNIVIYNTGVSSSANATIGHISGRGRVGATDPLARMSFGTDAIYYHGVIDFQVADDYAVGALETRLKLYTDEAVFNEDSANVDFRVESDGNTHMVFVDASTNKVGINASAPEATLDVKTDLAITEVASANATSQLNFYSRFSDSQRGFVVLKAESLASGSSDLVINARNSFTDAERLRIASTGDVTFTGNVTGVNNLTIANQIMHTGDTSNYMQFHQADGWRIVNSTGERFHIEGASVVFNHDGHDADFRVESSGNDHMLFVDASTNRVGVGKTAPNYPLDVANPNAAETTVTAAFRAGGDSDNNRSNIFIGQQENSRGLLIQGGRETGDRAIAEFILNGSGGTIGSNIVNFLQAYEVTGSTAFDVTINQDGENIDFKVESQNESQMFMVDASADAVTIGNQRFANTPTSTNNEFIHFSSPQQEVSSNSSTTINLFVRSASGTVVPCCGTVYVSCENSGQNVSWSYIIDFFYSNSTFTTTARATGNSQGTTTCTVQENGAGVSCTVAYTSGLGGNIRFHAGGHASVGNY